MWDPGRVVGKVLLQVVNRLAKGGNQVAALRMNSPRFQRWIDVVGCPDLVGTLNSLRRLRKLGRWPPMNATMLGTATKERGGVDSLTHCDLIARGTRQVLP
jgi:hypothetical protein